MTELIISRNMNEVRKIVDPYTTDKASTSNRRRKTRYQWRCSCNDLEKCVYPTMNDTTEQAASIAAHAANERWVSCQIAGA